MQRERQNCTKAVLLLCVASDVSQAFTQRYPKRGGGYGCSPTIHAGNLSSRPCGQDGNEYTPFPSRFQAGNAVFGNCAKGILSDGRGHAPPRWQLSMRRSRGYSPYVIKSRNFRGSRRLCKSQSGYSRPLYYPPSCLYPKLDFRFHPQTRG